MCPVCALFSLVVSERPRQDSNLRTRLRRPLLSPLSYGGFRTQQGYQPPGAPRGGRCIAAESSSNVGTRSRLDTLPSRPWPRLSDACS